MTLPVSPIFTSPVFNLSPVPGAGSTAPIDANFTTELLFLEMVNDPFFATPAAPLLGIESDQLALLEAEQESLAQAALSTDLAPIVTPGPGTNINPTPAPNVNPSPAMNASPSPGRAVNIVA